MKNRIEIIKSVTLIVLVAISGILSWNILGSKSGDQEAVPSTEAEEIHIQAKMELSTLLLPSQIVLHQDNSHYLTVDDEYLERIVTDFTQLPFSSYVDVTNYYATENISEAFTDMNAIELEFQTAIPFSVYKNLLTNSVNDYPAAEFNRIVIPFKGKSLYFLSLDKNRVMRATVDKQQLQLFINQYKELDQLSPATRLTVGQNHQFIYVPKEEVTLPIRLFYLQTLNISDFKKLLFPNLENVQQEITVAGEESTDGTSMLTVFQETKVFSFVKPQSVQKQTLSQATKFQNTVDFMNSHAGWDSSWDGTQDDGDGDRYRFAGQQSGEDRTVFRLQIDGRPVFNADGMSEIVLAVGAEGVHFYTRPYFFLDFEFSGEYPTKALISGEQVLEKLLIRENFDVENLEAMKIGYTMTQNKKSNQVILEPNWYIRYHNHWEEVDF